ncbi:MAG TPA: outer membrane beta-barrel protein [Gallionella sp.]
MTNICVGQCVSALVALLALAAATPAAWAYDSAVMVNLGQSAIDYKEVDSFGQARSVKKDLGSWSIGYIGRFNNYFGFDVRWGGAGSASSSGLTIQPGLFLSLLLRPSVPLGERVELYGLAGLTSLAVGRTTTSNTEEIIARAATSVGIGANFRITQHMAVGLEWVSYQRDVDFGPSSSSGAQNWTGVNQAKVSLGSIAANFKYQF